MGVDDDDGSKLLGVEEVEYVVDIDSVANDAMELKDDNNDDDLLEMKDFIFHDVDSEENGNDDVADNN